MPANDPVRVGQTVYITQCLVCHALDGAGAPTLGPDLNQPMNPLHYMTEAGLRALIRNPQEVRVWPQQQMVGFDPALLSDGELDGVIAYLRHKAHRRP
ncbi:hypothetical protein CCP1ISM_5730002 [Azospirillaceae bacterium]